MVQLQNSDRLNLVIELGSVEQTFDDNGVPENRFIKKNKTLCGLWSLNTAQIIQLAGLNQAQTQIIVIHHRESYQDITHAMLKGILYQITNITQDPYRNPTAYDLVTLQKVSERNE